MEIEREPEQDGETSSRGFLQTEDTRSKAVPKWSDVFGDNTATASNSGRNLTVKEQPQELLKKASRSYMRPTSVKAPPDRRAEVLSRGYGHCTPGKTTPDGRGAP